MNAPSLRRSAFVLAAFFATTVLPAQDPAPAPAPAPAPQGGIPECKDMQKTPSGLEYGFLQKGKEGPTPRPDDTVEVHYTGWLTDGTKFDSSRDRGQPASFGVTQVIKGWTEGLQLMTVGARCKFVIPGDIAYGPAGRPPKIPANATLVFDVELLKIVRMPTMPATKADAQKTLPSGVKWEIVKPGEGDPVGASDGVALRFAYWRPTGELLDCSEKQRDLRIKGAVSALPLAFLGELAAQCKPGTVLRAEVPAELYSGGGGPTVWEIEMADVYRGKVPTFRELDRAKIVTTQSGLQYEVIASGEGESPKATDKVTCHYTGWLTDGTLFDSSHARDETIEFPLNRVIAGWTEGVQLMKPGGKFLFSIPGEIAYGSRGSPPKIPANATLIFLVELKSVTK